MCTAELIKINLVMFEVSTPLSFHGWR